MNAIQAFTLRASYGRLNRLLADRSGFYLKKPALGSSSGFFMPAVCAKRPNDDLPATQVTVIVMNAIQAFTLRASYGRLNRLLVD